jgi:hypothetical protein
VSVLDGLVRPDATARVQIAGTGALPPGLSRADVKIVVSGVSRTTDLTVSNCRSAGTKVMTVRAQRTSTKLLVASLSKDGKLCLSTNSTAKIQLIVRRGWTSSSRQVTLIDAVKVLESVQGRKVPSRDNVIRVKLNGRSGLPQKVSYALISVTATGGAKDSSVLVGKCGAKRKSFVKVKAGKSAMATGWVTLKGGDLCVSASLPTPVLVTVLGVS